MDLEMLDLFFVIYTSVLTQARTAEHLSVAWNKSGEVETPSPTPRSELKWALPHQYATNRGHRIKSPTSELKHLQSSAKPKYQKMVKSENPILLHWNSDCADSKAPKSFKRTRISSCNFMRKPKLPGTMSTYLWELPCYDFHYPVASDSANQPNLTQRFASSSLLWNPRA